MIKDLGYSIYIPYTNGSNACADGYFKTNEHICQYKCGNNIITIKEHFEDKATAEHLIENVICYEKNNGDN